MFVFRNYTIENLFDEDVCFSGYGDISEIPASDSYLWFYNAPINMDREQSMTEIKGIGEKLRMVAAGIPSSSPFYIFSLEELFPVQISDTDDAIRTAIAEVNEIARTIGESNPNVRIIDFSEFLQSFRPSEWISWRFYFISQMVINPAISGQFREWWRKKLDGLSRIRKKCLVLDLDNTLWSGVLGEDGISGVKMSGDYPGNAFHYFQEGLIALSKAGVILTVCSKNNEEDVKELWEKNPFVRLTPEYISACRINWQNKADNIRELAGELNIGLDSMVFVDDNPTERALVRQELPMVAVPEFPKRPYDLMTFYRTLVEDYFKTYRLTAEDLGKTEQYKANAQRAGERAKFTDLGEFIRSLDIHVDIIKANEFNLPRIAQMTQKTNQFNLTTRRYSEADINAFISQGDDIYCISVRDKFGDNGITGAMIIRRNHDDAEIDTLLLSCRILGKNIETAFVNSVLNILLEEGVKTVRASFIPTLKNKQVSGFYDRTGFVVDSEKDGVKNYHIDLTGKIDISESYTIEIK